MPEWSGFAFQDATDAIYISVASMPARPTFQAGQILQITGQTHPGNFAPIVVADAIGVLGTGAMPAPIHSDWKYISSGACDNDYVEIQGVVRSAKVVDPPAWRWRTTAIHIDLGGNLVWAYLRDTRTPLTAQLPDADVRVRGVCLVLSNSRRQFEQNVLLVSNTTEVQILQAAPRDPFSAPLATVDHLFGFRPEASIQHRVRVQGIVTSVDDSRVFLQEKDNGLLVRTTSPSSVQVGDHAEAVGFAAPGTYSAILEDAVVRGSGPRTEPSPLNINASEIMTRSHDNRPVLPDAMLIRTEATVLESGRSAQEQTLMLQDGSTIFTARLKGWSRWHRLPHLEQGSRVKLTGVCVIQTGDLGTARSFELLMRSPADLQIVASAPWLTRSVALRAAGILLGIVAIAGIWLALLRRRVAVQTRTIRRQIERESLLEKRFRDLVENASDMVYMRDLEGHLLLVNHGAEHLTGYRRKELLRMNVVDLLVPEQREKARQQLGAKPSGAEPDLETAEWRFLRKDGREVTVEVKQRFLSEEDAEIRVQVIGRDVTARSRALADNQERFRTLADNIAQLAWMADERGFIFWYNQRWFDYTDASLDEARGWGWQKWHHPDHVDRVMTRIRRSFETGESWEDTFPLRGRDGQYRWFLGRAMPIRDAEGQVLRWFGTNTDITEQKLLETDLQRSNADLQQFAYVASHDLQEPLRNVCAFTQLLAKTYDNGDLSRQRRDYMDIITSGAKRMESLITDLLAYSRATGPKKLEAREVDFGIVLKKTLQHQGASLVESGATVTHDLLPIVTASESQLSQVVQNLIGNSIKYRRPDVPLRIHVSAEHQGDHWVFVFRDNGVGFDPQYAENVFGIFKRLHGSDIPGTGIGLAICKTIIERHGGRIWAESQKGQGATFYFTIPDGPQRPDSFSLAAQASEVHSE